MNRGKLINYISQAAVFGGLAAILYCVPAFQFNLPFVAPGFMSVHLDDIPILLSSLAYGPLLGVFEIILKTLIKLPMTSTMCIGELGDLMYSLALVVPAAWIYKKHRNIKGAIVGISVGLFFNLIASSIVNLYTIFQMYVHLVHFPEETILSGFNAIFGWNIQSILDPRLAILLIPFNLIKNAIIITATFVSYKPLRFVLEKIYK